ncbi:MAG: MATE family efflux transporter [Bacteroidales bacterium]|nr:MATE family efflux transporter [Bacteroidales bacterium]
MNRRILGLALPNIVTNITVPLLGMVDMAIVGHLSGDHIGAIAIGTQIFNLIYWNFGFLRMGTSGLTAQAFGAERWDEAVKILIRACAIALGIALLIILLQWPISLAVPHIFEGSNHVINLALTYFFVRIWAAPATLGLYAIKGWFIGMQDSKTPMWIAIALNCVNIVASLLFVLVLEWDIFGVALGTVIANYSGLAMGILLLRRKFRRFHPLSGFRFQVSGFKEALHWREMKLFFKVNSDIFLRTLCLSGVFTFITAASSHMGDQILAVDALLLQFFTLFSYIMDGFAYAGESLVGRHIGARQLRHLKLAVRLLIAWGLALTVVFTGLYAAFGDQFLHIFTDKQDVIAATGEYMGWVLAIPICGFAAFLFDGIFIGATATRTMRNAMFVATAAFFALYYGLKGYYGTSDIHTWNNILWIAFMVFLTLRGLLQALRVRKDIYGQVPPAPSNL